MKQIQPTLFFVALMISSLSLVHAQPNETNTFEKRSSIGFGFMSAGEIFQRINILSTVAYKFYTKNGTFRAMIGGATRQRSSLLTSNSIRSSGSARIGYQYNILIDRFMPYIGLDACAGVYENKYGGVKTESKSIGLSPTVGFEFWIVSKLSCYFEIRSDFIYRESTITRTKGVTKTSDIYTFIPPLGTMMMVFHF